MRRLLFFRCAAIAILLSMPAMAYSQAPGAGTTAEPAAAENESPPEPTSHESRIEVSEKRFSIDVSDKPFGDIIRSVAEKSDFELQLSEDVAQKTVTTRFTDLDTEKGILRLLSLIREKNYLFHYNSDGTLKKVEIFGDQALTSTVPSPSQPVSAPAGRRVYQPSSAPTPGMMKPTAPVPASSRARPARRPSALVPPVQPPATRNIANPDVRRPAPPGDVVITPDSDEPPAPSGN